MLCHVCESRLDDIQMKAAQAVGIFVVDAYRRSLVRLVSLFVSLTLEV